MTRTMRADHITVGWTAKSERSNSTWNMIDSLSVYEAQRHGRKLVGITADGPNATSVLYLTEAAGVEVVKGLLGELIKRPITLTADNEMKNILKQCLTAIEREEEEARQIVDCIRRDVDHQLKPKQ